jgi:hypothetical protein
VHGASEIFNQSILHEWKIQRSRGKRQKIDSVADPGCIPDPGSDFFPSRIPDPNCLHPGSRILIKEYKYLNPPKSKKMVSKL